MNVKKKLYLHCLFINKTNYICFISVSFSLNLNTVGGGVLPYKGLMGTCGQPGYVFRDFCLKQGIDFINFCLKQGIFS